MPTRPRDPVEPILLLVAILAAAAGVLTAFGQDWLPESAGSLANSVGSWGLVAFALGLLPRRRRSAALAGGLALAALVTGYYTADRLRGYPVSSRTVLFWLVAAAVAGPVLGLSAHWVRRDRPALASVGTGLISGVLVGEGVYGLRYISDTTYPPYWRGEIAAGVLVLVLAAVLRLRSSAATAMAILVAAVTAAAFVAVYGADLPGLL